jgi:protein-disulfide isomerase
VLLALGTALPTAVAQEDAPQSTAESLEDPFTDREEDAVKGLVREYILENPQIIAEAVQILRQREQQAQADRQKAAVEAQTAALNDPGALPVLGNPEGDVTVVEFFDYNCPYCRGVAEDVLETVKADGNVRLVLKELPILRDSSRVAAQAAIAAAQQDAYEEFHRRLMTEVTKINRKNVFALAGRMSLDVEQLKTDMQSQATKRTLQASFQLAQNLEIRGTPAFVVGEKVVPGAVDADRLKDLIAEARAAQAE